MSIPDNVWPAIVTAAATLAGVALTLRLSNKNQAIAREHERALERERRDHERRVAALEHRREIYESFLAAVDATEHAVSVVYSARQVGRQVDSDAAIVAGLIGATNELYKTRSLLKLYASPDVSSTGATLSAQVLDVNAAYQNSRQWQMDLLRFRDEFGEAVRQDIDPLIRGIAPRLHDA